jgi:chloramphenicol O-acetyltransferase
VFFPSYLFWRTRAINYIWANKLAVGQAVPNPYTSNAMMVAVQSGRTHMGEWMGERRNVLEDYRKFFGEDPPKVGAIAIMTDTDNTGEKAVAWYGLIAISSE